MKHFRIWTKKPGLSGGPLYLDIECKNTPEITRRGAPSLVVIAPNNNPEHNIVITIHSGVDRIEELSEAPKGQAI